MQHTKCTCQANTGRATSTPSGHDERTMGNDVVTLSLTLRGNRYVLTFTEYNSRYVEAFAIPNTQATTIARILVDEICFRYGAPQQLLSDLGANLISQVVAETCLLMGVERLFTDPYRSQTDGLLEQWNATMCKNLAMYVNEKHDDWDLYIKPCVSAVTPLQVSIQLSIPLSLLCMAENHYNPLTLY